jgi:LysM repeat protein
MVNKRFFKLIRIFSAAVILALLTMAAAPAVQVSAQSTCGPTYVVQYGDTMRKIATKCGVDVWALIAANPQIPNYNLIYPGQVLNMPGGSVVYPTLSLTPTSGPAGTVVTVTGAGWFPNGSVKVGVGPSGTEPANLVDVATTGSGTLSVQLTIPTGEADPGEVWQARGYVPGTNATAASNNFTVTPTSDPPPPTGGTYVVQRGDTLKKIAARYGITWQVLWQLNPQIINPNVIYVGQVLIVPGGDTGGQPPVPPTGGTTYVVQYGDTLKKIAARYGTTWQILWQLNPQITNPNFIYPGQVITLPGGSGQVQYYTVQQGDTLRKIAGYFNTTSQVLLSLNPTITNPNLIYPGQVIRVR